jgi:predicted HicB family RNase H-like nuclease
MSIENVDPSLHEDDSVFVVIHPPRSLRAAIESEAEREGVSLNQFVVAKLSVQMGQMMAAHNSA